MRFSACSSRAELLFLAFSAALVRRGARRRRYPTYSVATTVLISLASFALFQEKLSRRQVAAMVVILVALVLLNL